MKIKYLFPYRYQLRPSGKWFGESKKWISVDEAAIAGCMDKNFNKARVPHFFTPIIIACGRFFEFVTSEDEEDIIVDKRQTIISTKIIPLRQLKETRQHLTDIRITRWPATR